MKSVKYASALLLLGLASQAQATSYAWCLIQGERISLGLFPYYQSGIVEIEDGYDALEAFRQGPFAQGFLQYVQSNFSAKSHRVECDAQDTLEEAEDRTDYSITGGVRKKTGWLGGRPAAIDRNDPKPQYREDDLILTLPGQKVPVDSTKRTNSAAAKQQWEIDYEHKMAKYQEDLAKQQQAVADHQRQQAEFDAKRAENEARVKKARAEWERAVAACKAGDRAACTGATEQ